MAKTLITCLPELGFHNFPKLCSHRRLEAAPPMKSKLHPDCYELVYIVSGHQYRATNGFNYPLSGGQAILIQPGHRHSTGIMPQGTGHVYWLHIHVPKRRLLDMSLEESRAIFKHFRELKSPVFNLGKACQSHFEALMQLARKKASDLDRISIRQHLLGIIQLLLHPPDLPQRQQGMHYLQEYHKLFDQPAALAHALGISLSRLRARCKEETGISLGDYLLHLRIEEARRRIIQHAHLSITDIALDLGFSSSQYFATVFKRYTALTPTQFRNDTHSPEGKRRLIKLGLA